MTNSPELPWEVIHVISVLLKRFKSIEDECGLSIEELYILTHLKHFGKQNSDGEQLALRTDITNLLAEVFDCSPKQVSDGIDSLRERGCVRKDNLTRAEKQEIYGTQKGRMAAVILLEAGYQKIDDFINKLHGIYLDLTSQVQETINSQKAQPAASPLVNSIAAWLRAQAKDPQRDRGL